MTKPERLLLFLLAALNFTHILDFMIMMPLGNYLMPFFNISPQQFSFLVSTYTISAAISGFLSAFYVDGYDRKKVLVFAYCGFLIGTIACGLAPGYGFLLAARTVAGLFGGLIGAQVLSIVADTFAYERRGRAMGALMSAFAVASTLGVPFALYLSNLFSWHAPFLLVGLLGLILVPLLIRYIPPMTGHLQTHKSEAHKWQLLVNIIRQPNLYQALIFSGLLMFGHFIIVPFINPFMEFNMGFSKSETPLIYLVGGITSFFAANILGRISDQYGKLRVFTICVLLALPMVVAITNLPAMPLFFVLTLFGVWFVVATGRGVTAQALVSQVVPPEQRGSFQSFTSSSQQLGTGLASLAAGMIVSKGAQGQILYYNRVGLVSIGALVLCVWLARKLFLGMDHPVPTKE